MNILLLASHAVAEYDDLRMLSDLGYTVFAPGGYADPSAPSVDTRPPLPEACIPDAWQLRAWCGQQREKHAAEGDRWAIDWAKADLHPDLLEWADAIIVHHFPERWILGQWREIRHKRVIWRTCGQSDPDLERMLLPLRGQGLQIVRYSPAERRAFEPLHAFAGEDAMIRFGKYREDFPGWSPGGVDVRNVTQNMVGRAAACGLGFYREATQGLLALPAGEGSAELGGIGKLDYAAMGEYLAMGGAYLYCGTQPASYTLGLIEAMMVGIPVVSIGAKQMFFPPLFEGHEIVGAGYDVASEAGAALSEILGDENVAMALSTVQKARALDLFDVRKVGAQWREFLG